MKLVQNYRCTSIPWECWSRLGTLGWHSDSLQGKTPSASWFHERFQGKFCWWQVVFLPSCFLQISINRCKDSQVLGRKYHSISMHCWLWMWATTSPSSTKWLCTPATWLSVECFEEKTSKLLIVGYSGTSGETIQVFCSQHLTSSENEFKLISIIR